MAKLNCFCVPSLRKKKEKPDKQASSDMDCNKGLKTLQVRLENPVKSAEGDEIKQSSFSVPIPFSISGTSKFKVKVMSHESPVGGEVEEVAYEGEDEHDDQISMKRDNSDFDFQANFANSTEENDKSVNREIKTSGFFGTEINVQSKGKIRKIAEETLGEIKSGHLSDPGIGKTNIWSSPKLNRSCSDLETRDVLRKIADHLPRSRSFEEMQRLAEGVREEGFPGNVGSPISMISHCSADKVMLKKHSSSQILPSRSRKLWWKLFLWSHRNLHNPCPVKPEPVLINQAFTRQGGGYTSDTLEPRRGTELGTPSSITGESLNKGTNQKNDNQGWDGFHSIASGLWPQNQWVAFSTESSSLSRVDEWVKELSTQPLLIESEDNPDEGIVFPPSPDPGKLPVGATFHMSQHPNLSLPDEVVHANSIIQSLNSSSTVAHISSIGLKVVPSMSCFSSLRSVNLSGNFIVHTSPGHLPTSLHTLDLSRNKIAAIEGLRELTRLRVLDLSYNRISRIGHGLSNCALLKELYLTGNKISDVEGLHRFLKLTILDLSFNKISTTKGLGQLVANYNSLLALNLLGNPIQSNIGDDQLRKAVCGLLPKLAYLNKQPVNPQKAREVAPETIAKMTLGNKDRTSRRRMTKRVSQGALSSSSIHRGNASVAYKGRHRSKTRTHHQSPIKITSSAIASSSH